MASWRCCAIIERAIPHAGCQHVSIRRCPQSARAARDRRVWPGHLLVLGWFLFPLLVLSTREPKFPRQLFYLLPPMMGCLVVGPCLEPAPRAWAMGSRLVADGRRLYVPPGADNSQQTRAQEEWPVVG